MRVSIAVLGDLGRSPRMLNHAHALAAHGAHVDLIGYRGSVPHSVEQEPRIRCHFINEPSRSPRSRTGFVARGLIRVVAQTLSLLRVLLSVPRPDVVLVQAPPGIPALVVSLVAARLRSARLVIDWHNQTHAMLALRLGPQHTIVRMAERHERSVGRRADAHLCVSGALADDLRSRWGLKDVHVFRDRPAEIFARARDDVRASIVDRVRAHAGLTPGDPVALLVCPTSWGPDEDFDLLLECVEWCERLIADRDASQRPVPSLAILITGRGPLQGRYRERFESRAASRVHVQSVWLAAEEYPNVIGSADLGLCLHRSASGLDLPMKVSDMFGAGVPVCAFDYGPTLAELVRDGENGLLFTTAEQLAAQIVALLTGFPNDTTELGRLRGGATASGAIRWREGWVTEAWPTLRVIPLSERTSASPAPP